MSWASMIAAKKSAESGIIKLAAQPQDRTAIAPWPEGQT
jgi:hypothetical protein